MGGKADNNTRSPRVLVTSHESRFLGGSRRQRLCRLQIWTAPQQKSGSVVGPLGMQTPSIASFSTVSVIGRAGSSMSQIPPTNSRSPFNLTSPSSLSPRTMSAVSTSSGSSGNATITPEQRQGPARGTKAHLPLVPPCIVFFEQEANARDESDTTRSFLVVEGGYLSSCLDVKVVLTALPSCTRSVC
jgi:hypothetical protein